MENKSENETIQSLVTSFDQMLSVPADREEEKKQLESKTEDGVPDNKPTTLPAAAKEIRQDDSDIPKTLTAAELVASNEGETEFVVSGLIPTGVTVFTGKAKVGKSIAAQDIGISVAMGSRIFGVIDVQQLEVLYVSMEDTNRRIRKRIKQMLQNYPATEFFHSATSWPRMDRGCIAALESWIKIHPNVKLIIFDTYAKIRGFKRTGSSLYEKDYLEISAIKEFADKHHLAIILIHHLRKGSAQDAMDLVSGSVGITACADTILIMTRERSNGNANLYITGRDMDEKNLPLKLNPQNLSWELTDAAAQEKMSQEKKEIIELMKTSESPLKLGQIAEKLKKKKPVTHKHLAALIHDGWVYHTAYGLYAAVPESGETRESGESSTIAA